MTVLRLADHGAALVNDFGRLFCGEMLGKGIGREVYPLLTDPTKVVKIETASHSFQNVLEWQTWQDIRETRWARWLAPCHFISECGIVLIQERTEPIPRGREPERMPRWLTDFKASNYGLLKGRVVAHDYGTNCLISDGMSDRMQKVKWW